MEKIFKKDELTKKERVMRALLHKETDRAAIHDQLSFSPDVISLYTDKKINGFNYTEKDIGLAISKTLDSCFPIYAPNGTDTYTDGDGFVFKNDNWTRWHMSCPFDDEHGAKDWLLKRLKRDRENNKGFDENRHRKEYREYMTNMQSLVGETVIIDCTGTGFSFLFDYMGLEIYTFFACEYPDILTEFMETAAETAVKKAKSAADASLSPVVLIAEDFATKQGPIFSPDFLSKYHYPYVKKLTQAWKDAGVHVLYHSDGNYKKVIPDLMSCGVEGFYCLEPSCGMDIVLLKSKYPSMLWSGGVDGIDLMERGTPEMVREEVKRHIENTDVLQNGGMLIASSSEINPTVKAENFTAMINAVDEFRA